MKLSKERDSLALTAKKLARDLAKVIFLLFLIEFFKCYLMLFVYLYYALEESFYLISAKIVILYLLTTPSDCDKCFPNKSYIILLIGACLLSNFCFVIAFLLYMFFALLLVLR